MIDWRLPLCITGYLVLSSPVAMLAHEPPAIVLEELMAPPEWALLECELLRANSRAVEEFAATYLDERGYLLHYPRWGTLDGTDDAIETFHNWTLLHALGASESVFQLYKQALEGHLQQYKEVKTVTTEIARNGAYYREFMPMSDWHHNGEGMRGFHMFGLCDPLDPVFQERTRRFAGLYMNESPDAPNYDPQHRIIHSIWNGSKGPMLRRATREDWIGDPAIGWFHLLHGEHGNRQMVDIEEFYPQMLEHCAEYLHSAGDHPLNLAATGLALNAYMLAHETKYKNWLIEYVDAWKERIAQNGGNIPTNIGLDGTLGGETGGKWYGGTYGWAFSPWSPEHKETAHRNMFDKGAWPGFGNALLVTGNQDYVAVLRRQLENLYAQKKTVDGQTVIPHNYGDDGWYNFTTDLFIDRWTDIYTWSMNPSDLEKIPKTGWIGYLEGQNADYPVTALRSELGALRNLVQEMRNDPTTPDTRLADWALGLNPARTHELVQLMLGGYLTNRIYSLHCQVRYFDPARQRAGIPEDVAALVEKMSPDGITLSLVNVNQVESKTVIVQCGAYGEHQVIAVESNGRVIPVDAPWVTVRLAPGTGGRLHLKMQRYVNQPTWARPWDRAWMIRE